MHRKYYQSFCLLFITLFLGLGVAERLSAQDSLIVKEFAQLFSFDQADAHIPVLDHYSPQKEKSTEHIDIFNVEEELDVEHIMPVQLRAMQQLLTLIFADTFNFKIAEIKEKVDFECHSNIFAGLDQERHILFQYFRI